MVELESIHPRLSCVTNDSEMLKRRKMASKKAVQALEQDSNRTVVLRKDQSGEN